MKPEWISVEDRLPPDGQRVLCARAGLNVWVGYRLLGQWKWVNMEGSPLTVGSTTHWMPLPDPPKEEETK